MIPVSMKFLTTSKTSNCLGNSKPIIQRQTNRGMLLMVWHARIWCNRRGASTGQLEYTLHAASWTKGTNSHTQNQQQTIITISKMFFKLIITLSALSLTLAAVSFSPVECRDRLIDNIFMASICADYSGTTPIPVAFENGERGYVGDFTHEFSFRDDNNDDKQLFKVTVRRSDDSVCTVSVTNFDDDTSEPLECSSCKFCGDGMYDVDCTNLNLGAKTSSCESIFPENSFFYPFKETPSLVASGLKLYRETGIRFNGVTRNP